MNYKERAQTTLRYWMKKRLEKCKAFHKHKLSVTVHSDRADRHFDIFCLFLNFILNISRLWVPLALLLNILLDLPPSSLFLLLMSHTYCQSPSSPELPDFFLQEWFLQTLTSTASLPISYAQSRNSRVHVPSSAAPDLPFPRQIISDPDQATLYVLALLHIHTSHLSFAYMKSI